MKPQTKDKDIRGELVKEYFAHVDELRTGKEEAVAKLVDMWDADGTFEFVGTPPVNGTFHGRNAIHTLYNNRFVANRMPLALKGTGKSKKSEETELGVVHTTPHHTRLMDDKVVVGWATKIGTADQRGFKVSGSHTFKFKDGKISSLKVVVSPKADDADKLDLTALGVDDIGRLSLAAWMVV